MTSSGNWRVPQTPCHLNLALYSQRMAKIHSELLREGIAASSRKLPGQLTYCRPPLEETAQNVPRQTKKTICILRFLFWTNRAQSALSWMNRFSSSGSVCISRAVSLEWLNRISLADVSGPINMSHPVHTKIEFCERTEEKCVKNKECDTARNTSTFGHGKDGGGGRGGGGIGREYLAWVDMQKMWEDTREKELGKAGTKYPHIPLLL